MTKTERQNIILHEASIHNRVLLNDLAVLLGVSVDTIRRDIIELDKRKEIVRIHGGAQAKGFQPYSLQPEGIYSNEQKMIIAQKALEYIAPNSVSLISGGTTNLALARIIPHSLKATFFTPSLPMAMQLLERKGLEVILIGGKLSRDAQIALGGNALNTLAGIRFDTCFLGTSYLDVKYGLTELDWEVVQLKKAMISASAQVISLAIAEKLGSSQRYKICDIESIDVLITELPPTHKELVTYRTLGVQVV